MNMVGKGTFVSVHTIKAYGGSDVIAPLILIRGTRWKLVPNLSSSQFTAGESNANV